MLYFIAAYNNLIPTANEGNYQALKRKYLGQLAREAPPFLAYIEMYDFSRGMCSGGHFPQLKVHANGVYHTRLLDM